MSIEVKQAVFIGATGEYENGRVSLELPTDFLNITIKQAKELRAELKTAIAQAQVAKANR